MNETRNEPQGWYLDPYGRHELRWFSVGQPTALVRDGGVDGHDPVAGAPPPTVPVPAPEVVGQATGTGSGEEPLHEVWSAAFGNSGVQP